MRRENSSMHGCAPPHLSIRRQYKDREPIPTYAQDSGSALRPADRIGASAVLLASTVTVASGCGSDLTSLLDSPVVISHPSYEAI